MRFAHIETYSRARPVSVARLERCQDEVLLTAMAQNLRRLVNFLSRRPQVADACPA